MGENERIALQEEIGVWKQVVSILLVALFSAMSFFVLNYNTQDSLVLVWTSAAIAVLAFVVVFAFITIYDIIAQIRRLQC